MLIKCYLNYIIMASLRRHSELTPLREADRVAEARGAWSGPGVPDSPLLSAELQPPRALYQHLIPVSICLKMAANAGSMFQYWKRFDLQQLQVSGLSYRPPRRLLSSWPLSRVLLFYSERRWELFCLVAASRGREFKSSSSSHWWKWLRRWSEIDPLCSIRHRSDSLQQAGATSLRWWWWGGMRRNKKPRNGEGASAEVGSLYRCVLFNFYRSW